MIPEPGQLVEVRRRLWVVADVEGSAVGEAAASHLVRLGSVDEDGRRDELEVVWELEPGGRVVERAGLPKPTAWDDAEKLDAFLDAVRWGAATNADRRMLQAPFRSGASIEDYQLDPVARAVDMARVNLLIADDTGLGKTIETGLVIQELLLRHRVRTVLVVCPASLQEKWRMEMREKFGLEFRIVDTEYVRDLRRRRGIHANPWTSYPRLIASVDWMKGGEALRWLEEVLPARPSFPRRFDMLVVDEAHNVAPSASANHTVDSRRTRLIRRLSPHFEHRVFLSATPHNGYQASFTALLELLDDQRFSRSVEPDPQQLQRVMVRRLKSELVDADGEPVFPKRELLSLEVDYDEAERGVHRDLAAYAASRTASVQADEGGPAVHFVLKLLKKRLFSSPRAFAKTLEVHRQGLNGNRTRPADRLDERILLKAMQRAEEDYADETEAETALEEANARASATVSPPTPEQAQLLERMTTWAQDAKNRPDSKARAILAWLAGHLRPDGVWNDKRVVLFTEYRDTKAWLAEILASNGYGGDRLMQIDGGVPHDERERIKAAFQARPSDAPVRILLATDAASEGIDLQNWCNYMIHVEIPWNPNVLEQRNGRIDRHGQREKDVLIWHPVGRSGTSDRANDDSEFLLRAARKVEAIRQDLGSVGPVLARRIEDAMLGRSRTLDTTDIERRATAARGSVAVERKLRDRVSELHARLTESRTEFGLEPARVVRAVSLALELEGQAPLVPVDLEGAPAGSVFEVPTLTGAWGRATLGLGHPYTGRRRPLTFDHEVAKGRDDMVLAHLEHEIVQLSLGLLRAEVWSLEDRKHLHRVGVRTLPDAVLARPAVVVWSRLLVTGGDHRRLHEELTLAGGELEHDRFTRVTQVGRLRELLAEARPATPTGALFDALADRFTRHEQSLLGAVEARSRDRLVNLRNTLERRANQEAADIVAVLNDLEKALKEELDRPEPTVIPLFTLPETEQLRRDRQALAERLARIPAEREREVEAVRLRYADPTSRTFPVAVVFLVPERLLGGTAR